MSSLTDGRNNRPSMIFISGRTTAACVPRPRSTAVASEPSSRLNNFSSRRGSEVTRGLPSESCLTPGASTTIRTSLRDRALPDSDTEPLRKTMARSSRPVSCSVLDIPTDMARTATSTATTPALPMMTTKEGPSRCGRLRKFKATTALICATKFTVPLSAGQSVDDVDSSGSPRRRKPAHNSPQDGNPQSCLQHRRRWRQGAEQRAHHEKSDSRQCQSDQPTNDAQEGSVEQDQG